MAKSKVSECAVLLREAKMNIINCPRAYLLCAFLVVSPIIASAQYYCQYDFSTDKDLILQLNNAFTLKARIIADINESGSLRIQVTKNIKLVLADFLDAKDFKYTVINGTQGCVFLDDIFHNGQLYLAFSVQSATATAQQDHQNVFYLYRFDKPSGKFKQISFDGSNNLYLTRAIALYKDKLIYFSSTCDGNASPLPNYSYCEKTHKDEFYCRQASFKNIETNTCLILQNARYGFNGTTTSGSILDVLMEPSRFMMLEECNETCREQSESNHAQ